MANNITIITGGGHAGIEAAVALENLKERCLLITMDRGAIGRLSCNPAIGGLGKSHLVKEIDALGGVMGEATDFSALQYKTLNKTKGRAVWSLRAQVDKKKYPKYILNRFFKSSFISVLEDEVVSFKTKNKKICSVVLKKNKPIQCKALIITCGTFLNGLIHIGESSFPAGRLGERPALGLTETLKTYGFTVGRLKTGTPPRLDGSTIDWEKTAKAKGDRFSPSFSLFSKKQPQTNAPCFVINTNKKTHQIINKNIHKSAMFSGKILGVGPRYCPSVEDKVFRFKKKLSHHLFLEPEWKNSNQIYLNGFSTSLPQDVQIESLKSIPALKQVSLVRPGYAIEYDFSPPYQLKNSLESKEIRGLFFAGQINGTSGYEEAAAQGLVAGINAYKYIKQQAPFVLERKASYIGVMVDDLITSHLDEPYRMFTSRAENRLFLRSDNVYSRLFPLARDLGLVSQKKLCVCHNYFSTLMRILDHIDSSSIKEGGKTVPLKKFLRRPSSNIQNLINPRLFSLPYSSRASFEAETTIKYSGYIENERERFLSLKRLENLKIPKNTSYKNISGLSIESIRRLTKIKPQTLGQASRISGIRPTDLIVVSALIKQTVSRET